MKNITALVTLILLATGLCYYNHHHKDRVLLSSINTLTFYSSKYTTGNRSRPIPQMNCLGGSAGCRYMPSSMQCYNRGSDGKDVQWECKAELDRGVSLGETVVSCEGYDYPEDPYILAGSCGVEFYLNKNRDFNKNHHNYDYRTSRAPYQYHWFNPIGWFWTVVENLKDIALFCFVVFWIVSIIGLNTIFKCLWFAVKVIFFPFYLLSCCCCNSQRESYRNFVPPPPYYNNAWGNGFYHNNHNYHEHHYYHDHDHYYHDDDDDHHTSTSYASTSRR